MILATSTMIEILTLAFDVTTSIESINAGGIHENG